MIGLMDLESLWIDSQGETADFWGRRAGEAQFSRRFRLFGWPVTAVSNQPGVLTAVDHAIPAYSTAPARTDAGFHIQFVVQPMRLPPGPAPADLIQRITYTGGGEWLAMQLGGWGMAFVDLARKRATAVLTPELAQQPKLVAQVVLHTILLNFVIASGAGMLHASALLGADERLLLLMAPHNSGKSTTALRLALAGWRLMTDSMVFALPDSGLVAGFPVGQVKLREDVAASIPELSPFLQPEPVRQEMKYRLDLREFEEALVETAVIAPKNMSLCLLSRHDRPETMIEPAGRTAVWQSVMANSLYYDETAVWQRNLTQLEPLIRRAQSFRLTIGADSDQLVAVLRQLGHDRG